MKRFHVTSRFFYFALSFGAVFSEPTLAKIAEIVVDGNGYTIDVNRKKQTITVTPYHVVRTSSREFGVERFAGAVYLRMQGCEPVRAEPLSVTARARLWYECPPEIGHPTKVKELIVCGNLDPYGDAWRTATCN